MKRIILLFSVLTLFCLDPSKVMAQDLHFSNNAIIPTFFNPAQTGAFAGTYRAGLIYRDQWRSAATPYQSGGLFIDSPVVFGLTKQHWVGVGATLFYDKAGEVPQTWSGFYPGVSYHIAFDKKFRNIITIGAQYGFATRGNSQQNYISEYTVLTGPKDPDLEHIKAQNGDFSAGYGDLNIGLLFKSHLDKYSKIEVGAAFMHVLNPSVKFEGDGQQSKVGNRINFHTQYRRATSRRMIWEPSIYFSKMPGASNTQIQLRNEYLLKKKGDFAIITGLGFRVGDAVQLLTGAIYKDWVFSLSYDHGISGLTEGGYVSSFELGAKRIFIVNKKPKVKPIIYCPRL